MSESNVEQEATIVQEQGDVEALTARADDAESRVGELEAKLESLSDELQSLMEEQQSSEASRELESLLRDAGVIDLEAATTLANQLIEGEELAPPEAVATLKREKRFLFAQQANSLSAMSGAGRIGGDLEEVANTARASGDRRELMRYMRLRRSA